MFRRMFRRMCSEMFSNVPKCSELRWLRGPWHISRTFMEHSRTFLSRNVLECATSPLTNAAWNIWVHQRTFLSTFARTFLAVLYCLRKFSFNLARELLNFHMPGRADDKIGSLRFLCAFPGHRKWDSGSGTTWKDRTSWNVTAHFSNIRYARSVL